MISISVGDRNARVRAHRAIESAEHEIQSMRPTSRTRLERFLGHGCRESVEGWYAVDVEALSALILVKQRSGCCALEAD